MKIQYCNTVGYKKSCVVALLFVPSRSVIDPSTVFVTFDKDQLANIHRHYWKERLKSSKLAKFESDMSEVREYIAL